MVNYLNLKLSVFFRILDQLNSLQLMELKSQIMQGFFLDYILPGILTGKLQILRFSNLIVTLNGDHGFFR